MAIIAPGSTPIADQIRQKLGRTCEYGCRFYGAFFYGEVHDFYGIYQIRKGVNGQIIVKEKFYISINPQTEAQQANRQKYADSVLAWQNLTDEQKLVYNNKAKGRKLSGYNLFQKQYLLSA